MRDAPSRSCRPARTWPMPLRAARLPDDGAGVDESRGRLERLPGRPRSGGNDRERDRRRGGPAADGRRSVRLRRENERVLFDGHLQSRTRRIANASSNSTSFLPAPTSSSNARHIFSSARTGRFVRGSVRHARQSSARQLELRNDVAMGQTAACANPARRHVSVNGSISTSCSSTPKSRVAFTDAGICAWPTPGSENTATPVGVRTRAISRDAPPPCRARDASRSGRRPCRTTPSANGSRSRSPATAGSDGASARSRLTASISCAMSTATGLPVEPLQQVGTPAGAGAEIERCGRRAPAAAASSRRRSRGGARDFRRTSPSPAGGNGFSRSHARPPVRER